MRDSSRIAIGLAAALACCGPGLAAAPGAAEPKVVASIGVAEKQPPGYCLVSAKVSDSKTEAVLAAPTIVLRAGSEASTTSTDQGQTVEFKVKAAEACAGGTYVVTLSTGGKPSHVLRGELQPKRS